MNATTTPEVAPKISPRDELDVLMLSRAATATADERARVAAIVSGKTGLSVQEITPAMAAIIVTEHNADRNRDLSVRKVNDYADAMQRGEWKLTHQGLAFYGDGNVADGQHRCYACAVSGIAITATVFPNFGDDAFNAIDLSKRTVGDALKLNGVIDGKVKSAIAKSVMEYEHKQKYGTKPHLTIIQIERFVLTHDKEIEHCMKTGQNIAANIGSPVLGVSESAMILFGMLRGGYTENHAVAFLSALQIGQGASDKEPQVLLNGIFDKAKNAKKAAEKLNREMKMALAFKAAAMFSTGSVGRLTFDPRKEQLPAATPPDKALMAAE